MGKMEKRKKTSSSGRKSRKVLYLIIACACVLTAGGVVLAVGYMRNHARETTQELLTTYMSYIPEKNAHVP